MEKTIAEKRQIADEIVKLILSKNVTLYDFNMIIRFVDEKKGDMLLKEKESEDS